VEYSLAISWKHCKECTFFLFIKEGDNLGKLEEDIENH
jgi:hypothetical protein